VSEDIDAARSSGLKLDIWTCTRPRAGGTALQTYGTPPTGWFGCNDSKAPASFFRATNNAALHIARFRIQIIGVTTKWGLVYHAEELMPRRLCFTECFRMCRIDNDREEGIDILVCTR
jgi:hypothetical protein